MKRTIVSTDALMSRKHAQKCVLVVVEDESQNFLVQKTLHETGFSTRSAVSGADALEILLHNPDLALLVDQQLTEIALGDLIRALKDRGRSNPFVVMNATGDDPSTIELMKLGAKDVFVSVNGIWPR